MSFEDEQYFIDKPNGLPPSTPLPEQGGFNERLKEELVKQRRLVEDGFYSRIIADEKLADAIRTLVLEEIIGEDERTDTDSIRSWEDGHQRAGRNDLRTEQRKKLEDTDVTK